MMHTPPDWASLVRSLFADLLPDGIPSCRQHLVGHCTPLIASTMVWNSSEINYSALQCLAISRRESFKYAAFWMLFKAVS